MPASSTSIRWSDQDRHAVVNGGSDPRRRRTSRGWETIVRPVDIDDFLARPLIARVAVNGPNGPTIRPVWFLYEGGAFWWLTGSSYSRLGEWLSVDPRVALTVDTCDLETGVVLAMTVVGRAVVHPFDPALARRKFAKYLGPDSDRWDVRFRATFDDPTTRLVAVTPEHSLNLRDMSFEPSR